MAARNERNTQIEEATTAAVAAIDAFIGGETVDLPPASLRHAADTQLNHRSSSVRLASLFLAFYAVVDTGWDVDCIPTGIRGQYGDKALSGALAERHITLHNAITAFGENLGWKGNVSNARLSTDERFQDFATALTGASEADRLKLARYMASRFADSRQEIRALPAVGPDVLTFARAKQLFHRLLDVPSEGNIPQFLIAAMLLVLRRRVGVEVRTHHAHASDTFDRAAGDIEEYRDGELIRAYEVTVRPDWKHRLADFRAKMDAFGLAKYVIIARDVNTDEELAEPARLLAFVEPVGRDLAVVDISDVVAVITAELSAAELREVVNTAYDLLSQPRLCGRPDILGRFRGVVDQWLDGRAE